MKKLRIEYEIDESRIVPATGRRDVMKITVCGYMLALALIFGGIAWGDYQIVWSTIDGGGGQSAGGQYVLTGTIGQPDASYSEGGNYELLGGFWPGGPLCLVDFEEFAIFAEYWLESGSDLPADLDTDGDVDLNDLRLFVYDWLCLCPYNWPLK